MEIRITVVTEDADLTTVLTGDAQPVVVGDGITWRYESSELREALGAPDITNFLVEFGREMAGAAKDLAIGVFAAWLYDKLKDRKARVGINGKEVPVEVESMRVAIEQEVRMDADEVLYVVDERDNAGRTPGIPAHPLQACEGTSWPAASWDLFDSCGVRDHPRADRDNPVHARGP